MSVEDATAAPQPVSPDELTQYHAAAEIANRTVLRVANECVVGRRVLDLCAAGDKLIVQEVCVGVLFVWVWAYLCVCIYVCV